MTVLIVETDKENLQRQTFITFVMLEQEALNCWGLEPIVYLAVAWQIGDRHQSVGELWANCRQIIMSTSRYKTPLKVEHSFRLDPSVQDI